MARSRKPVLITDAVDPEREFRHRERRYVAMMLLRAACLVGGAIIVSTRPPLWQLWAILCVLGMILLPWFAVILANDRPARTKAERAAAAQARQPQPGGPLAVPGSRSDRVIDGR